MMHCVVVEAFCLLILCIESLSRGSSREIVLPLFFSFFASKVHLYFIFATDSELIASFFFRRGCVVVFEDEAELLKKMEMVLMFFDLERVICARVICIINDRWRLRGETVAYFTSQLLR